MRYLNPKADLTFKKVFGEHPDLIRSFLNALLPFETPEEEIDELQGLWLEAHPPAQAAWIIENTCIGEGVFRSILDSTRPHPKEVFRLIWSREILKGVRLGTPEVAELCMAALMEYRTFRCKKTENEPHSAL